MVAVAQLVRALVCGTGGRGFKIPLMKIKTLSIISATPFILRFFLELEDNL